MPLTESGFPTDRPYVNSAGHFILPAGITQEIEAGATLSYAGTAALGGAVTADSIVGSTDPLPIAGKATGSGVAGGALSVTGGAPSAGNAAGGAVTHTGGAGSGSGAGGASTVRGGVGGATGTGGAVSLIGGASAGAGGTSGGVFLKAGAAAGGAAGVVDIQSSAGTSKLKVNDTGIGFFAATPVAKQTAAVDVTGFAAGVGTTAKSDSVYAGAAGATAYSVGDLVTALKAYGLLTS